MNLEPVTALLIITLIVVGVLLFFAHKKSHTLSRELTEEKAKFSKTRLEITRLRATLAVEGFTKEEITHAIRTALNDLKQY